MPSRVTEKAEENNKDSMKTDGKEKSTLKSYLTSGSGKGGGVKGVGKDRGDDTMQDKNEKMISKSGFGRGGGIDEDFFKDNEGCKPSGWKNTTTVIEVDGEMIDLYDSPDEDAVMDDEASNEEGGMGNMKRRTEEEKEKEDNSRRVGNIGYGGEAEMSDCGTGDYSYGGGKLNNRDDGKTASSRSGKKIVKKVDAESGKKFLADEAFKLATNEMELEAIRYRQACRVNKNSAMDYVSFWKKKLVTISGTDGIGEDSNYGIKERLCEYVEQKIKKAILEKVEKQQGAENDVEPGVQPPKRQKQQEVNMNDKSEDLQGKKDEIVDISDDETVVTSTSSAKNAEPKEGEWKTVMAKMKKKQKNDKKTEVISVLKTSKNQRYRVKKTITIAENDNKKEVNTERPKITNGKQILVGNNMQKEGEQQVKIPTFLEALKNKKRAENQNSVRLNFAFTPRSATKNEIKKVAVELMHIASTIDDKVLLLPWNETDESVDFGPVNSNDLMNPSALVREIMQYINKPKYANLIPGQTIYKMGFRVSTTINSHSFIRKWNSSKQKMKETYNNFYSVNLAPMQASSEAYMIGIAAGSSEDQDVDLLNSRLAGVTGIDGIEASFQNVNQPGVTNDFWRIANEKAETTMAYKNSREYLRCKYRWAPNALVIYVSKASKVTEARKRMIEMYGKGDTRWPDGTIMRFLPLKNGHIKSERTRAIVKKRMAYHIWLKAHDKVMLTNFQNIHSGADIFSGHTFGEKILNMATEMDSNQPFFRHFKRGWNADPSKETWLLATNPDKLAKANEFLQTIQEKLTEEYGEQIQQFFCEKKGGQTLQGREAVQDDDDEKWFQEDDIDGLIKAGVLKNDFIQFLNGSADDDKQSVLSWGTGETNYTDLETVTKESMSQGVSSITPDAFLSANDILDRRNLVKERLNKLLQDKAEVQNILERKPPYELVMSGIELPTWNVETEIMMITAFRDQIIKTNKNENHEE